MIDLKIVDGNATTKVFVIPHRMVVSSWQEAVQWSCMVNPLHCSPLSRHTLIRVGLVSILRGVSDTKA